MSNILVHYGTKRHSGRYPWGSGGDLLAKIDSLYAKGLSEVEVGKVLEMSTGELRNQKALAKLELKEDARLNVIRQREGGMSVAAISREFNIPAATVRDLLKPEANIKFQIIKNISDALRDMVSKFGFVDVGSGTEVFLGVSETKLKNALTLLRNEDFQVYNLKQEQLGGGGTKKTTVQVLGSPDSTFGQLLDSKTDIAVPNYPFTNDGGINFFKPENINNISSDRVLVKYNDDGGGLKDGLIEMRPGVPELNIGSKAYAQVRIGVDGTHFMKGMAVMKDDIPSGFDVIYNTSKDRTSDKLAAMKLQQEEGASRFGAIVRPNQFMKNGKEEFGVVNIVGEKKPSVEGAWAEWSRNLSSQVLSKQSPKIALQQLQITYENSLAELNEISDLTNPTVRQHLLTEFADKADRATVDLKASALPRQTTNVLLPDPGMKPNEIYAPNYNNGESVVLIRYPHGGVFEIPTLTVNNKASQYREIIGTAAKDAVAINPEVAQKLSGADYDGDFVLVIPNKNKEIRTAPSLEALKDFDPHRAYPKYDGMKVMTERQKQRQMGDVSNLITDMTVKGASQDEIASAVRHSMVVIDAEKHELNYKQSRIDNRISALKERYQGGKTKGAATLISRAKSEDRVLARHDHYSIDPDTGEKVYTNTNETYINKKTGATIERTLKSTKIEVAYARGDDARDLSSGTVIEKVYADHANKMRNLANTARLKTLEQSDVTYSRSAKKTFAAEVDALNAKYKEVIRHQPIERKAQLVGSEIFKARVEENPSMSRAEKQKAKGQSLVLARSLLGAKKPVIEITNREWSAIELGAVSPTRLKSILRYADMDSVRAHATPRALKGGLSTGKKTRAKALLKSGYTTAEVASALGVSASAIRDLDKS